MKKLIAILCFALTACALPLKEEKFVNPIFYKPMEGLAYNPELYKIRPNKLFEQNFYGYNTTADCDMLENTENTVVLKCLHTPEPPNHLQIADDIPTLRIYKFYIWPEEEQDSDIGTYVRLTDYPQGEEEYPSHHALIITYSPKNHMKVWGDAINTFEEDTDN